MNRILVSLALSLPLLGADVPRITRATMTTVEQNIDASIRNLDVNDPYELLGFSRGVYLPGFGVVITAEVNLVVTPISPFHLPPAGPQIVRLRQKKMQRLTPVRELMRNTLVAVATTLDPVPAGEQVVFGLTLFYRAFEQREGLPGQIIMQAPKQTLLDFKANRISQAQLDAAIQVQEL